MSKLPKNIHLLLKELLNVRCNHTFSIEIINIRHYRQSNDNNDVIIVIAYANYYFIH
jgi:hypothetical protein